MPSIIEISKPAFTYVTSRHNFDYAFNGAILDSNFPNNHFDLVFTMGVLIHINPDDLIKNLSRIYDYSKKYILLGEYFNRTPISIEYQGKKDRLFKRDFGKLLIENFDVELVDYGFLWGHIFDAADLMTLLGGYSKKNRHKHNVSRAIKNELSISYRFVVAYWHWPCYPMPHAGKRITGS